MSVENVIEELSNETKAWMKREEERLGKMQRALNELEKKSNRIALGGAGIERSGVAGEASDDEVKALVQWARTGQVEQKAMSIGSDPSGGYTVPTSLADQITEVGAEEGAIRGLARVIPLDSGEFEMPIAKNLAGASHVGETSTRSETTTPDFAAFAPAGGGLAAVAGATNWLLADSGYDLAKFIVDSIGQQFGVTEGADFVAGDGVGKSQGFTAYTLAAAGDATRTWGQIEKLHAGSTSAFDVDDLIDLLGKLAPRYRKRAAWVMHPDTEGFVRKLKSSSTGDYYWQPSTAAGTPPTLLGLPCLIDVNVPTIASAAPVVALADWQKFYAILDIGKTLLLRDQLTSKGRTLFYAEKRVAGGVLDFNAGKLLVMSV